jgi:hypothetical protein
MFKLLLCIAVIISPLRLNIIIAFLCSMSKITDLIAPFKNALAVCSHEEDSCVASLNIVSICLVYALYEASYIDPSFCLACLFSMNLF